MKETLHIDSAEDRGSFPPKHAAVLADVREHSRMRKHDAPAWLFDRHEETSGTHIVCVILTLELHKSVTLVLAGDSVLRQIHIDCIMSQRPQREGKKDSMINTDGRDMLFFRGIQGSDF